MTDWHATDCIVIYWVLVMFVSMPFNMYEQYVCVIVTSDITYD